MHSGRKGRSGSHRPYPSTRPGWLTIDAEEIVEQAVRLGKSGMNSAQVGAVLRDSYGVPSSRVITGSRLTDLLATHGVKPDLPEDLQALLKRVVHLQRHLETHPKDLSNQRGLSLMESRIRRLAHYYRQKKRLPTDWRYTSQTAVLQVE
ncbi:MAG: 30S ribosomal protein S15 [Thermoplasmata archaeon]